MAAVPALLCCCGGGGGIPQCPGLPTALLVEWTGSCEVTWAGTCAGSPSFLSSKTGFVSVSGLSNVLTLQYTPFGCNYTSLCDPPTTEYITETTCDSGASGPSPVYVAKCISTPLPTAVGPLYKWTITVTPLWGALPSCFPISGTGPQAKYSMFSSSPVDPRGTYSYESGTLVGTPDPIPTCGVTVVQDYGFVTVS